MGSRNETPNTPNASETELREMHVDELREAAREEGVSGASGMRKEELVRAVAQERSRGGGDQGDGGGEPGAGPDGGRIRTGPETSPSVKHAQEVTSRDDDPERPGRSLVTDAYQEERSDGRPSNFFRLESPEREDA